MNQRTDLNFAPTFVSQRDNLIEEVTTPVPRMREEAAAEETATSVSAPSSPGTITGLSQSAVTDALTSSLGQLRPHAAQGTFHCNNTEFILQE